MVSIFFDKLKISPTIGGKTAFNKFGRAKFINK